MPTLETPEAIEAEYALEAPLKCPGCAAPTQTLSVVRLLRMKVNFTSNLPRRGYALACPACKTLLSATISSRIGL